MFPQTAEQRRLEQHRLAQQQQLEQARSAMRQQHQVVQQPQFRSDQERFIISLCDICIED